MSWYPLGRPVGTTIYPGMQITSVALWKALNHFGANISLNDVCCYVPAWFGALATLLLGLLTWECTGSANSAVVAAAIMSVIPAHIMRSVGGGYDNESVAMTAMMLTFFLWNHSIRGSKVVAVLAAAAYVYMVAAWGGYIFVINMVGVHAAALVALGYFNDSVYWAYTIFYILGTYGAMHVPVVGWTPLKSLEQLGPCAVFVFYQTLQAGEFERRKKGLTFHSKEAWTIRMRNFGVVATAGAILVAALFPTGYFGPLSSRVRGLLVKHTRTGNPLVDSVAEHQPANEQAYKTYLHHTYKVAPYGLFLAALVSRAQARFLVLWAAVVFFFANKMMRLILLTGPVASALSGFAIGFTLDWSLDQLSDWTDELAEAGSGAKADSDKKAGDKKSAGKKDGKKNDTTEAKAKDKADAALFDPLLKELAKLGAVFTGVYNSKPVRGARKLAAAALLFGMAVGGKQYGKEFWEYSHNMAEQLSSPSIMFHAQLRDGTMITVDDYRQAYWWLRDNTPEDARVMAWWDYGYQISGIANRTTIADGNTWNHEHIATLGRCLTAPEKEAHRIVRHLADYVLIWTGGGGDDLAKSPHMARIGNSVFSDICPGDPTCSQFGFYQGGTPTPMMAESLLYKLHSHLAKPGVTVDKDRFKEVYRSQYGKVRIYQVLKVDKESREWVANPANRICDAPGSWYCNGQYPPALSKLIARRKNFAQLEDFNTGGGNKEYTKEYMARMAGEKGPSARPTKTPSKEKAKARPKPEPDFDDADDAEAEDAAAKAKARQAMPKKLTPKRRSKKWVEQVPWEDTEQTSMMFQLLEKNDLSTLNEWLETQPDAVHMRSADGRGPLFWANEFKNADAVKLLKKFKVRDDVVDKNGNAP